MKKHLFLVPLLALSLIATGCQKPLDATTIVVAGPATQEAFITGRLAALKNSDSKWQNVTFEFANIGEDKIDSEVVDWTATTAPDLFHFPSDKVLTLFQASALNKVPTDNANWIDNNHTAAGISAATFANAKYGYPYAGDNGYFLHYNTDELSASDVADVDTLLNKAAAAGKKVSFNFPEAFWGAGIMFSYGGKYEIDFANNGQINSITTNFTSEAGKNAANAAWRIMRHSAWQAGIAPTDGVPLVAASDGSWNVSSNIAAVGADSLAFAKLPRVKTDAGVEANMGSFLGCKLLGVNALKTGNNAQRIAALHDVARWMSETESQTLRFNTFQTAPTLKAVAALPAVAANPAVKAINDQAAFATAQTAVPPQIWDGMATFMTALQGMETYVAENVDALLLALHNTLITHN